MKPRLDLRHGIWRCWTLGKGRGCTVWIAGFGHTPQLAFKDWQKEDEVFQISLIPPIRRLHA